MRGAVVYQPSSRGGRSAIAALFVCLILPACGGDDEGPLSEPDEATTLEETAVRIPVLANDSDPDGDSLVLYRGPTLDPAYGIVTIARDVLVYMPARDFNGDVDFSYVVSDGVLRTDADVHVRVTPVNDAPVTSPVTVSIGRNQSTELTLSAIDVDGDALTYEVVGEPSHGTLTGTGAARTYLPAVGYAGHDAIRFVARDAELTSAESTIDIVVAESMAPVAHYQDVTLNEDNEAAIALDGSDADGDPLTFAIASPPAHGTLTGTAPALTYHPAPDYHGFDMFTFTVNDGALTSPTALVDISVLAQADAPVATPRELTTLEDMPLPIGLTATDGDGDALTFAIATPPTHGTLTGTAPALTYVPAANYHGTDSFVFRASDGTSTGTATVSLTIAPVPDAPVAQAQTVTLLEDHTAGITLAASDADGDSITFAAGTPANGTLSGTGPELVFTPAANYHGTTSFAFTATTSEGSTTATVTLIVQSVNDAPVAAATTIGATEDVAQTISLSATDVDGDILTYTILTPPTAGTLAGTGATRTYTPSPDRNGADAFTFQVSDGAAQSSATVQIAIAPVADPPRPRRDLAQIAPGTPATIDVLGNDEDPEGDAVDLVSVAAAGHGSASIAEDAVAYTPAASFSGSEQLAYTVTDPGGLEGSAILYLGVGMFPGGVPQLALAPISDGASVVWQTDLSGDGRYVVFLTTAKLVAADLNESVDAYVHDRLDGTNQLISVKLDGTAAGAVSWPTISDDGRYVAFTTFAPGIVAGDVTTGSSDLFVRDRATGTTVIASRSSAGVQSSSFGILRAAISGDGRHVAFLTKAFELVENDSNGAVDAFVRDLDTGVTERVSLTASGVELDLGVEFDTVAVDHDGSVVAFVSTSNSVVADGGTGKGIFVRDRAAGTTVRASRSTAGVPADSDSKRPALSADGRVVAFVSSATNLIVGDTNAVADAFVHDLATGNTYRAPVAGSPALAVAISANGRYLAVHYDTATDIVVVNDRIAGTGGSICKAPNGDFPDGAIGPGAISADGRYVSFVSSALNLGVDPQPTGPDLFVAPNPL